MSHNYDAPLAPDVLAGLDAGVREFVRILHDVGHVETFESCEGTEGHSYKAPTVRFSGNNAAGWHALSVAMDHGLPVRQLNRAWLMEDGEPAGPVWELVFWKVSA